MGENYYNELKKENLAFYVNTENGMQKIDKLDFADVEMVNCEDWDLISNVIKIASSAFECFTDRLNEVFIALFGIDKEVIEACQNSRVRHLALYSRKKRTRKKNIHRAFRIVERDNKHVKTLV